MKTPRAPALPTGAEALQPPVTAAVPQPDTPATSSPPSPCRCDGWTLRVAPLQIERFGLTYASQSELAIDLRAVAPGRYRVLAVHNFHVEDRNPLLHEGLAGIFLAAQRGDGSWEEPERFPVECRALGLLALIDVPAGHAAGLPQEVEA